MKRLLAIILWATLSLSGISMAHDGDIHIRDMKCTLNGFGESPDFQRLAKTITQSIDSTVYNPESLVQGFPAKFREQIGGLPGNHRSLAHKWVVGEAIPKETLDMLERDFPGKRGQIIDLWRNHSRQVINVTQQLTGLPPQKAKAMASLLSSIHLLGDVEPGNTLIDDVLSVDDIAKNIKRDLAELGGKDSPLVKSIEQKIDKVVHSARQGKITKVAKLIARGEGMTAAEAERVLVQRTARELMDVLYSAEIGPAIRQGCSHMALDFSETALAKAANTTLRCRFDRVPKLAGQGVEGEARLTRQAFGKGTAYAKEVLQASGKQAAVGATEQTVVAAGLIQQNGSILIPSLCAGAAEGGAVFVIDAGVASYQYLQGDITRPEMVREIEDAAIKGAMVGSSAAVAVLLGATPAGWVVLGVGAGAYFVTDIALGYYHECQDGKYLNDDDLKAFGIEENSPLDLLDVGESSLDMWISN